MIKKIVNPGFFRKGEKSYMKTSMEIFLMKRFNINIKMRRKTRGLQIYLRIHFNKNNKLIVCLQECFHNVQNVSRLRHEHPRSPAASINMVNA